MLRIAFVLIGFAGCIATPDHQQVALADQHRTSILVFPPTDASAAALTLYFETEVLGRDGEDPTDCPTAPDSLAVLVDNTPLTLEEPGGWDAPVDGTSSCHQIRFSGPFTPDPTRGVISILDSTSAWTIAGHSFATFDHLVVQPSPRGQLAVASALGQAIDYVELRVTQGNVEVHGSPDPGAQSIIQIDITGDTATMALPPTLTGAVSIDVTGRTVSTPTCNGPVACKLDDPVDGTLAATIN